MVDGGALLMPQPRVAVVGGGYAGLAAAVELADAGMPVTVFETSRILGGRARKVDFGERTVDNGQHILIGAYAATLRLMRKVGVDMDAALLRLPLTLRYPGFELAAPRLPAPLHMAVALLTARGLDWSDRIAAIRFMQWLKARRFRLAADITVDALLSEQAQTATLRRYLWEPLCISAMNTPSGQASAQVFANVLRDSLAANRAASDLLIPQVNLSALFAEPAARFIAQHGGEVRPATAVGSITAVAGGYRLDAAPDVTFTHVILAVAPYHLPRLVAGLPALGEMAAQVETLAWEPIVTCYLRYPAGTRLPAPMLGLTGGYTHWVFDRGQLDGNDGLFAVVISASGRHQELERQALADAVHAELKTLVPDLPQPLSNQVITEKRATFACTPALHRPATQTALPGILLAGDYIASDYPATLEGAIRSGVLAAKTIV